MIYIWKCPQCESTVRTTLCCPRPQCCGGFDMNLVEQYRNRSIEMIVKKTKW